MEATDLSVGSELPVLTKSAGRIQTTVFCAAIRNFHQVHFDEELCRKQGWTTIIVPGFLMGNWCIESVTKALGGQAVVNSARFKMTAVAYIDRPLRVVGEVTKLENGGDRNIVTCKLRVVDENDQVVTVATVCASTPAKVIN
ncbi:MaoC family dehydratase [Rhodococcus opacus]|uniref:MaoC family dehydratase n=1 Tax=Rhodococcus opacus TaxID=37919 RepID=UPI00294A70CB|nr:MaoC family dehydratase N-terminal domain-containing protein [Rhodococcus opacus]MDV6244867.1 MaoC family dehydratase N-terminal domain-containing protein [Rhodococcus opacus]